MKLCCALLCWMFLANVLAAAESPPHIVLVLADDLGLGDLSCYGGEIIETPHLDQIAREGTRFTQYYSPAPICSPARCGLITGQFPVRWNITSFLQDKKGNAACEQADFLDAAAPSLPRALKNVGCATAHFGKWHLGGGRDVTMAPKFAAYGYDEAAGTWESPEPHPDITATNWIWSDQDKVKRWDRTAYFVDRTLQFIAKHSEQPCFVNVWLDDPHTPWVPEAVAKGEKPKPQSLENLKKVLTELDKQLGRLAKELPTNTLLLFISDNGPLPTFQAKRSTKLRGSKLSLYEGGIRVPFFARWPGKVPAGLVDDKSVIAGIDLLPTLATIGGAKLPADYQPDGEDVSGQLLGKPTSRTKPLFWEYGRNETSFKYPAASDRSPQLAMRDGQWKLLINADGSQLELYDLAADPREQADVVKEHAEVAATMRDKLLAWKRSLPKLNSAP